VTLKTLRLPVNPTPKGWRLESEKLDGQRYLRGHDASLIWSMAIELDGRLWLHISMAGRYRVPTWAELVAAKEWIAGTESVGYQVLPPRSQWVNIHATALHIWVPMEGQPPLPDFTQGGDSI
jgi:hypothetical protein